MLLGVLPSLAALALGVAMALAGGAHPRVLSPLRSFALAAVLVAIGLHLLPEALEAGGPAVLLVFVAGVGLPSGLSRLVGLVRGDSAAAHGPVAGALAVAGVLLHQAGDGIALASFIGPEHAGHVHWDIVLGIAVHTVPLAAVITLASVARRGRRAAVVSGVAMAGALLAGLALGRSGGAGVGSSAAPWISAAVAGLLVHVLTHDVPSPPRTAAARTIELGAIVVGIALPFVAMLGGDPHEALGHAVHAHEPSALAAIGEVALRVAPFALAALLVTLLARRALVAVVRRGVHGARALVLAPLLAACACELGPLTRTLAAGRARLALTIAAPELHAVTIALSVALLGWRVAVARLGLALLLAAVVARVFERPISMRQRRAAPVALDELVLHTTPWLVAGIVAAGLAHLAIEPGALASTGAVPLDVLLAMAVGGVTFVCAPAATPLAAVLVERGLSPAAALAALAVGNAATGWRAVRGDRSRGTRAWALLVIGGVTAPVALALAQLPWPGAAVEVHADHLEFGWQVVPLGLLGLLLLRAWWRYGLAAWIEPLHGGEHHHHQHATGAPCTPDCHDDDAPAPVTPLLAPRTSALAHLHRGPLDPGHDDHGH